MTFKGTFTLFTPCKVKKLSKCTLPFDCLITSIGPVQGNGSPGQYYMNPALKDFALLPDSIVEVDFFRSCNIQRELREISTEECDCSVWLL